MKEHVLQEAAVSKEAKTKTGIDFDIQSLYAFYQTNKDNAEYATIFNFFYGDAATASLGNKTSGIKEEFAGYRFSKWLASH